MIFVNTSPEIAASYKHQTESVWSMETASDEVENVNFKLAFYDPVSVSPG